VCAKAEGLHARDAISTGFTLPEIRERLRARGMNREDLQEQVAHLNPRDKVSAEAMEVVKISPGLRFRDYRLPIGAVNDPAGDA
jgi:hypothetical protein